MRTETKLKLAWKYRRQLWKYRSLIRHRKAIAGAAVVCAAGIAAWLLIQASGTSSPSTASNG